MAPTAPSPADELITIRDVVRYGVSRFNASKLTYGHGTATAVDEAAFMVLESLSLPIDELAPWLEARLTTAERGKIIDLFEQRITTRKPAPYLLGKAYIQGVPFRVDERVIIPRSYLGELLLGGTLGQDGLGLIPDPFAITSVLDLCTGSGCLAILAAMCFPEAAIDAVDLSADALDVARLNVADHRMEQRIRLEQGDLFEPLAGRRYDLIIANPPYVAAAEVAAFPPEYQSEPVLAHHGGPDGLDTVRRILAQAGTYLNTNGGLICEIGTGRGFIEQEFSNLPFLWLDSEASDGEVFWLNARDLGQQA